MKISYRHTFLKSAFQFPVVCTELITADIPKVSIHSTLLRTITDCDVFQWQRFHRPCSILQLWHWLPRRAWQVWQSAAAHAQVPSPAAAHVPAHPSVSAAEVLKLVSANKGETTQMLNLIHQDPEDDSPWTGSWSRHEKAESSTAQSSKTQFKGCRDTLLGQHREREPGAKWSHS